jgi:hypothetical protein
MDGDVIPVWLQLLIAGVAVAALLWVAWSRWSGRG